MGQGQSAELYRASHLADIVVKPSGRFALRRDRSPRAEPPVQAQSPPRSRAEFDVRSSRPTANCSSTRAPERAAGARRGRVRHGVSFMGVRAAIRTLLGEPVPGRYGLEGLRQRHEELSLSARVLHVSGVVGLLPMV